MRLNLHARIEMALAIALLLGSCGSDTKSHFSDAERDEIADIAGDAAPDTTADSGKVSELESDVAALEAKLASLEVTVETNAKAHNTSEDIQSQNAEVLNRALERISRLESRLGM